LKDSNKAMGLYINEIIGRLLQTGGFEHVLEKDVNKQLPTLPQQDRRQAHVRMNVETTSRRAIAVDNPGPQNKRISPEAGITVGLSRAFSFRKRQEISNGTANLRPLKLVEEQHPQGSLRSDGTMSHSRAHTDDNEIDDNRAAKRASWVPGWFGKAGVASPEK
jgi:hypothetical protein